MKDYEVKVKECSKELSARERISFKDTTDAVKLDEICEENSTLIEPAYFGTLSIHNEKSDNKDYEVFVIVAKDDQKYVTGSNSFMKAFKDIAEEMESEPDEKWGVKVYKLDSKNFKGKKFITCSIV